MAELPPDPYPGAPRWVKVAAIAAAAVVLLLVLLMVLNGGRHGPGRHLRTGEAGMDTPQGTSPR